MGKNRGLVKGGVNWGGWIFCLSGSKNLYAPHSFRYPPSFNGFAAEKIPSSQVSHRGLFDCNIIYAKFNNGSSWIFSQNQ